MTLFSDTAVLASYVGPTTTTVGGCFEKDLKAKSVFKSYKFSEKAAEQTLKRAGAVTLASTVTSSLQNCQANQVIRNAQLYVESLNEQELYEMVQLLEAKEETLIGAEIDYDMGQNEETKSVGKVLEKKI